MTLATGARQQVGYVAESTWGTTPATPSFNEIPCNSFNVNLSKDIYTDPTLQTDRTIRFLKHGNKHVGGDIAVSMRHEVYDDLLQSALHGNWTTNVLKGGTTKHPFTIEQGQPDINVFRQFKGCYINKYTLTVPANDVVSSTFTFIGRDMTVGASTADDSGSYTAASAKEPFVHLGGTFKEGGGAVSNITAINFTLDNQYTENFALGSSLSRDNVYGYAKITGAVTAFFEDQQMLNKFINESLSSIEFTLTDGVDTFNVLLPAVKYTASTINVANTQGIVITLPFEALYDATEGTNIKFTRS